MFVSWGWGLWWQWTSSRNDRRRPNLNLTPRPLHPQRDPQQRSTAKPPAAKPPNRSTDPPADSQQAQHRATCAQSMRYISHDIHSCPTGTAASFTTQGQPVTANHCPTAGAEDSSATTWETRRAARDPHSCLGNRHLPATAAVWMGLSVAFSFASLPPTVYGAYWASHCREPNPFHKHPEFPPDGSVPKRIPQSGLALAGSRARALIRRVAMAIKKASAAGNRAAHLPPRPPPRHADIPTHVSSASPKARQGGNEARGGQGRVEA